MVDFIDEGGWLLILSVWVIILSFSANRVAARISTAALVLACATSVVGEAVFDRSVYVEAVTANGLIFAIAAFVARRHSLSMLSWAFAAATVSYYVVYIYAVSGRYLDAGYYLMLVPIEMLIVIFSVGEGCGRCTYCDRRSSLGGNFYDGGSVDK